MDSLQYANIFLAPGSPRVDAVVKMSSQKGQKVTVTFPGLLATLWLSQLRMPHVLFVAKAHCSLLFSWGSPKTTHSFLWSCLLCSQLPAHRTSWAGSSIKCKPLLLLVLMLLRFLSACFSSLFWSSQQEPCLTVAAHSPHWVLLTDLLGVSHCPLVMAFMKTFSSIGVIIDPCY